MRITTNTAAPIAASIGLVMASVALVVMQPDPGVAAVAAGGVTIGAISARAHWKGREARP